jgi:LPS sulfotransferase NodH
MNLPFTELNLERKPDFLKDPETELFLEEMNRHLKPMEERLYAVDAPDQPFIFVVGLPRSGTTLLSQILAAGLEIGYVNNLMSRFWLAPVTGLRLSRAVCGSSRASTFRSSYGATSDPMDVHEFGYFWRHWLQKRTFQDVRDAHKAEDLIDWCGLRRVLANLQAQFKAPMVFKNIFGSYHIDRLHRELGQVVYLYVERDPLDVAVSILQARQKYYSDINKWWSYVPPDYEKVINEDHWTQIAGQVHYLKRYYSRNFSRFPEPQRVVHVKFSDLCNNPRGVISRVQDVLMNEFGVAPAKLEGIPASFPQRTHDAHTDARTRFAQLLEDFARNDP